MNLICEVSLFNSRDDIENGIVYNNFNRKKDSLTFDSTIINNMNSINEDRLKEIVCKCLEQDSQRFK